MRSSSSLHGIVASFHHPLAALAAAVAISSGCGGGGPGEPMAPPDGAVLLDTTLASFRTEEGLTIRADPITRLAIVPPSYQYASGERVAVTHGATIAKTVTRLGWTGELTAAELEGANGPNVPALRLAVPYAPNLAVESVRATVEIACAGCSFEPQLVDLSPWASTVDGGMSQLYLVPIASNTIPALAQLPAGTAQVQLEITAEAHLEVGSTARGGPWSVSVDLLGPPLAAVEDEGYAAEALANSAYYYRARDSQYTQLFTIAPFSADSGVRLFHFVVSNPWPVDAFLRADLGTSAWTLTEVWTGFDAGDVSRTFVKGGVNCTSYAAEPCNGSTQTYWAPASGSWRCGSPADHPANRAPDAANVPVSLSGAPFVRAFVGGAAATVSEGRILVPHASGDVPGRVDLFVERPIVVAANRTGLPALTWSAARSEFTVPFESAIAYQSGSDTIQMCGAMVPVLLSTWSGNEWHRRLESAAERISGTLSLRSTSVAGAGSPMPVVDADLAARTISH